MLKLIKRLVAPAKHSRSARAQEGWRPCPLPLQAEPLVMVEVIEGNAEKDWELWRDSVSQLDSQMQSLEPAPRGNSDWHPSRRAADAYSGARLCDR